MMKRLSLITLYVGVFVLLLGFCAYAAGARVNTTNSLSVGLYWMTDSPVEKGAYVIFCPPPNDVFDEAKHRGYFGAGFCPGNYEYLMKKILAAKKDKVIVADDGVSVNGALLPFSEPLKADRFGRPLPVLRAEYELGDSDLLLMTDVSPKSFDSRYFGLINRSQIKGVIRPVFTW
jgi:conjugative transfer signal peptidase TraF